MAAITTQPTRVTCFGYANIALWITSFLVGFLPPYLQVIRALYSQNLFLKNKGFSIKAFSLFYSSTSYYAKKTCTSRGVDELLSWYKASFFAA